MEEKTFITDDYPDEVLLLGYIRGELSPDQTRKVETWMGADEANERLVTDLAKIYYAQWTQERMNARDTDTAYRVVEKRMDRKKRAFWRRYAVTAAACLAFFLLGGMAVWLMKVDGGEQKKWIVANSNAGMRTRLQLPDGSMVHLNSASRIAYPQAFTGKTREVSLTGEAFFEVEKDAAKPFIVNIGDGRLRVRVLGTTFNAEAYVGEEEVGITLVEGLVEVDIKNKENEWGTLELAPSEKAILNLKTGECFVKKAYRQQETAWIDGKLIFRNSSLPEVLKELSHYYNVKVEVFDPVIYSYRFTGTFENRQLSQVLDYLKISSNLDYTIRYSNEDDSNGMKYTTVQLRKKR